MLPFRFVKISLVNKTFPFFIKLDNIGFPFLLPLRRNTETKRLFEDKRGNSRMEVEITFASQPQTDASYFPTFFDKFLTMIVAMLS